MPKVGKKKFAYTPKGVKAAKSEAKKTGRKMSGGAKKPRSQSGGSKFPRRTSY